MCALRAQNGLRHGQGKQTRPTGTVYEGGFANGEMSGQGRYTYANGDEYHGAFAHGKFNGEGSYRFASEDAPPLEGTFCDGQLV